MRSYGYWNDKSNIVKELASIVAETGCFPNSSQMPKTLWTAIKNHKISIHTLRTDFGFPSTEKPKGYWKNFRNIKAEIEKIISQNNNKFPTLVQISQELGTGAKKAVLEAGGIYAVAKLMGEEYRLPDSTGSYLTTDGHYVLSGYEYLLDEFLYSRRIDHEVNGTIVPDKAYRYDFKVGDTYIEIWGYEKHRQQKRCLTYNERRVKKEKLYKENNLQLVSIECDLFKKPIDAILVEFDRICEHHGWNRNKVSEINLDNYYKLCKRWSEDKIRHELQKIIDRTAKFPTAEFLKSEKYGGLLDAISRHGGLSYFATVFGYKPKKPNGVNHWNHATVVQEAAKVLQKYPSPPTC